MQADDVLGSEFVQIVSKLMVVTQALCIGLVLQQYCAKLALSVRFEAVLGTYEKLAICAYHNVLAASNVKTKQASIVTVQHSA